MSDFDRLREVLLGAERARLDQHDGAIEQARQAHATLPEQLPQLLEAAQRGDGREALHRALAPAVAAALGDAVKRDRRTIVDALFPIIGPTIRKAIAEALRSFVGDLNRALEQSLSLRGWAWRFEAWRSRVPYAQVVVKHTLRYRIDHLFLIERESGLLLHRYSAPELPDLDSDAIAGMLTAIGDFVRDSVQADADSDGGLASATVGEHLLQVSRGRSPCSPASCAACRRARSPMHCAADSRTCTAAKQRRRRRGCHSTGTRRRRASSTSPCCRIWKCPRRVRRRRAGRWCCSHWWQRWRCSGSACVNGSSMASRSACGR
ncbi:MAG: hypothetical protein IPO66_01475 [Rhodanobacteraceae bacterium]|nr:hypothetical protein [Rhodanobacteraceae bacterium]